MKMLSAKDIAERYGVCAKTARRYMHSMGCRTKPLRVSIAKVEAWDKRNELPAVDYLKEVKKAEIVERLLMRQKVRENLENSEAGIRKRKAGQGCRI